MQAGVNDLEEIKTLEDAIGMIKLLLVQVAKLEVEKAQQGKEICELKEEIARLKKNSETSSKPPSSDITKPQSEQRQPGKRKRGGQPGHKGYWRRELTPEQINETKEFHLDQCPKCGSTKLKNEDAKQIRRHQQAELVENPIWVTEYRCFGRFCPCCTQVQYPPLPEGVIPAQILGPKLLSLCGYMKATMGVSISELQQFFVEVLKLPLSRASIQSAIFRVSQALRPSYEEALASLPEQKSLNIDETGWKDNGKQHWVWLFCTNLIACFVIDKSRGCQVLKKILGETFGGAITSDFYSAYVCYASAKQQFCLAHLIRDIKFLITLPDQTTKLFGMKLLAYMRRLFKLWHNRELLTPEQFQRRASRLKSALNNCLFAQQFPRGSDARRIQRRMIKHWSSLFRFLEHPELYQPTNNLAEQALRLLVRLRRISQGTRGISGQLWTARAATVTVSCRRQQRSLWIFIQQAVSAHFFATSPPSLISTT